MLRRKPPPLLLFGVCVVAASFALVALVVLVRDGLFVQSTAAAGADRLTVYWLREDFEWGQNWEFLCFDLLRDLGMPVRLVLLETNDDWAKWPARPGRVLIASMHENLAVKLARIYEAGITSKYGLLILNDEWGAFDQDRHVPAEVPLVIRPYYSPLKYPPATAQREVVYVPPGYLHGRIVASKTAALLMPASTRDLGCWFAGSERAERVPMLLAFKRGEDMDHPLCRLDETEGFGLGLSAAEYALTMLRTKLALCPGGMSVETMRVYEAWESGALPVMTEGDLAKAHWNVTHPGARVLIVPSWDDAPQLIRAWLDPANAQQLDELQAYSLAWYAQFKQSLRSRLSRAIRSRL